MNKFDSKWFPFQNLSIEAPTRLFCFHYAGGSAQVFKTWQAQVSSQFEVCPIELPGRWGRISEKPSLRLTPLIEEIGKAIRPHQDRPFAFFGHSFGALVSYELARSLRDLNQPLPFRLFLSARRAPQIVRHHRTLYNLPDQELLQAVEGRYAAFPKVILDDPEMMDLFLGILRADFEAIETHQHRSSAPLDIPFTLFSGVHDSEVTTDDIEAWKSLSTQECSSHSFAGDHFFMKSHEAPLIQSIKNYMQI
jgi:medium-chain acyl-[acyl-carrier-protein] hydrolase